MNGTQCDRELASTFPKDNPILILRVQFKRKVRAPGLLRPSPAGQRNNRVITRRPYLRCRAYFPLTWPLPSQPGVGQLRRTQVRGTRVRFRIPRFWVSQAQEKGEKSRLEEKNMQRKRWKGEREG